jgi:hypothetical protein
MTDLDMALDIYQQNPEDSKMQAKFYDLFLNSNFYVPTLAEDGAVGEVTAAKSDNAVPMIIDGEGDDYLMLFDREDRLYAWAEAEVSYVLVAGYALAKMSQPPLHWALNVGTKFPKQFLPEEIAWLRDVVERCDAEARTAPPA